MDRKKTSILDIRILLIVLVVTGLALFLIIVRGLSGGFNSDNSGKGIETYSSIEEMLKDTSMKPNIPEFMYTDKVQVQVTLNKIIEINSGNAVLKIAYFVGKNADPLGLYEHSENVEKYFFSDNETGIPELIIRTGYSEYPGCTLVNWWDNTYTYGLMLDGEYTLDDVLTLLNIDKEYLSIGDNAEEDTDTVNYRLGDKFSVELPKFGNEVTFQDLDGYTSLYFDKTLCAIFVYNDYDVDNNTFDGQKELKISDSLYLYYREDNPFNDDSEAFVDYNKFLSTIDGISETVSVLN